MPSNFSLATERTPSSVKQTPNSNQGPIFETHTLFVNVSVKIDWSIHVRWLTLAHV